MLKLRLITGLVLVLALLIIIFLMPASIYLAAMAFVCLAATWEWTALAGLQNTVARLGYLAVIAGLMTALGVQISAQLPLLILALPWWLLVFWLVLQYPERTGQWSGRVKMQIAGLLVVLPAWCALLMVREHPDFKFLFTLMVTLIACTDIGAYFSGKRFGKRKLAPDVSPNKTWEGFIGGVVLCTSVMAVTGLWLLLENHLSLTGYLVSVSGAACMAAISVVGDLYESMCKRHRGLKDSGKILPGHGGMLDRIDSFTAATPVYILLVMLAERV